MVKRERGEAGSQERGIQEGFLKEGVPVLGLNS